MLLETYSAYSRCRESGLLDVDLKRYRESVGYYCMDHDGSEEDCLPPFPLSDRFKKIIYAVFQTPPPEPQACDESEELYELDADGYDLIRSIANGLRYWITNAADEEVSCKAKYVVDTLGILGCCMGAARNMPNVAHYTVDVLEYASKQIGLKTRTGDDGLVDGGAVRKKAGGKDGTRAKHEYEKCPKPMELVDAGNDAYLKIQDYSIVWQLTPRQEFKLTLSQGYVWRLIVKILESQEGIGITSDDRKKIVDGLRSRNRGSKSANSVRNFLNSVVDLAVNNGKAIKSKNVVKSFKASLRAPWSGFERRKLA